jgi:hypothetical protein
MRPPEPVPASSTGTGACFALFKWPQDKERAERSRDLRRALDIKVPEHPIWVEVLVVSIVRVIAWPIHLIVRDT